jgi:hypothetical protein
MSDEDLQRAMSYNTLENKENLKKNAVNFAKNNKNNLKKVAINNKDVIA